MRVTLEARTLSQPGGGTRRYTAELLKQLVREPAIELSVIADSTTAQESYAGVPITTVPLKHKVFLSRWLNHSVPRTLRQLQPDVVHFTKAAIPKRREYPTVVTIYDIIPLLLPSSQKVAARLMWPRMLRHAATESDHIITISDASKRDIVAAFDVPPAKITVTPLAVDPSEFKPAPPGDIERIRVKYGLPEKYLLFVGTLEPRKNVPALIDAFGRIASEIPHHLVIAGRPYKAEDTQKAYRKSAVNDRIHLLDFVENSDLVALYSGASLFIWPSAYEGWGFPPQEAMACGTPVIVSDGGSLLEVVGDAGIVVPFSAEQVKERLNDESFIQRLTQTIGHVLHDEQHLEKLRHNGRTHATRNTWQNVVQQTVNVYTAVIKSSKENK